MRVMIVEDSAVARELLRHVLESDPEIEVVGVACDGEEALVKAAQMQPHVITMDIHMPELNGYDTTRRIMETQPVPIIIVSASADPNDVRKAFRVMDAGAVAMVETPRGLAHPEHRRMASKLVRTVKLMSEIKVIKRWRRPAPAESAAVPESIKALAAKRKIELVVIGASTGGPPVLHTILGSLEKNLNVPILIVQHIAAGFVQGLVEWLAQSSGVPIHLATHGVRPQPGNVYIAPDGAHMVVEKSGRIALTDDAPDEGLRPAVSHLFRSVAETFGDRAAGILLTGMGRDGAAELKLMRDRGAVTIAQNRESSVVFGMPGEAVKLEAAAYVLPPAGIAAVLDMLLHKRSVDA